MTTTHVPTAQLFIHPQAFLRLGCEKGGGGGVGVVVRPGLQAAVKCSAGTESTDTDSKIEGA